MSKILSRIPRGLLLGSSSSIHTHRHIMTSSPPPSLTLTRTSQSLPFSIPPIYSTIRSIRKSSIQRNRNTNSKKKKKNRGGLELSVKICIEDSLPQHPSFSDVQTIAEALKLNAPMAMKLALDALQESQFETRDTSITDVTQFDEIELSVLLCDDDFMQKLNKDWRGVDATTDVLSMSQHIPQLKLPILMLGDIVVSVDTAARQAEERGHSLLDEVRILMVHGLLHLLGFDHELSEEAEEEMGKEEEAILTSLGWKGKGLIKSAQDSTTDESL